MNPKNKHSEKKTRRRWPWIALLCIIAIPGLVRLALMSGAVQEWARKMIVSTANNQLIPKLSIENISGDLWNEATLTNIELIDDNKTVVASVDTLRLAYSPLSYFSDAFQIGEVRLSGPYVKLSQRADSTWNVQNWVRASDTPSDTAAGGFNFSLARLLIEKGKVDISMPQLQRDSSFVIDNLNLSSRIGYYGDRYEAAIRNLDFKIKNTSLETPISLAAAAEANETAVSLEKLAIATGYSMFNISGNADLGDSTAAIEAEALPLGWRDLATYMEDMPVQKNIRLTLGLEATASSFNVHLNADAEGIKQFKLESRIRRDSTFFELTSLVLTAGQLDLAVLTGDSTMPSLQNLAFRAGGRVSGDRYENARLNGTLSAGNIDLGSYGFDGLQGRFTLANKKAQVRLEPAIDGEKLVARAEISGIWDEQPFVRMEVHGSEINPANWLQEEAYAGHLSFSGEVAGRGWYPGKELWDYRITIDKSRVMDQRLDYAIFTGRFNRQRATNLSRAKVNESKLELRAEVRQLQTTPLFSYSAAGSNINLANFPGLEDYPSSISAVIRGKGEGSGLQNMEMQNSVQVDSSILLGEAIRDFSAEIAIDNAILTIQDGTLKSNMAEGNFKGRLHLEKPYDAGNSLSLGITLKDLSSFASVADVEVLQATGTIDGTLSPNGQGRVRFAGKADLGEVNYDNQYLAREISGEVRIELSENPAYMADFEIVSPSVASVVLQNIMLKTEGQLTGETAHGTYEFELSGSNDGHILQAGGYRVNGDSVSVEMTALDLTSRAHMLSLQKPFHVAWAHNTLRTDTLLISSKDDSVFMELAVPVADSLHQKGYLRAEKLNLRSIQEAILNNAYFEGMLFGEAHIDRTDTSLAASGDLAMSDIQLESTAFDSLLLHVDIGNERLEGLMELHQGGELIADGNLDIPFKAENPQLLDGRFFEQPVSGQLNVHAVELDRFSALLEQAGYEYTGGILQFMGRLEGNAGRPKLEATLDLRKALLSGVPIDSLVASADYQHTRSNLNFNATLTSLKQEALRANAQIPLDIDLHTWEVGLPDPRDTISIAVQTDQFNLKALNDFLNRDIARNLRGYINGFVEIKGPRGDLRTSGEISLQKGAVRLVPADIRLDNIRSKLLFKPGEIELATLRMKSGSGNLSAQGTMALNELVPGDINFSVNAENFKIANTDEYNGIINLDADVGGSVSKPSLSGSLDVISGFVELDNFGEKSVEEVSLDTSLAPKPNISLYDSLSLEMDIGFNRRFFIRNQRYLEMELELDGQIDLLKDPGGELQMFGNLNAVNGYAEPLGKHFELEEGSVAFSGPVDNPEVDVRTLYEPPQADQEIKIWYVIEGSVEDPQFKYESSPEMDLAGIISYTLFGQPFYKLNPAEQSVASASSSNAAADFAVEVLMDRVESLATRHLGIDVVRIENTRVGGESGTSISTGWYINPRVFFAIQNVIAGSTPTTGFYLEYYLKEDLRLILNQDNDNRQSIDLQWKHDY